MKDNSKNCDDERNQNEKGKQNSQRNITREKKVVQVLERNNGITWEENRLVYIEGRIYVPNSKKIKEEILKENHDLVDVGYSG